MRFLVLLLIGSISALSNKVQAQSFSPSAKEYFLIAHRGGIVNEHHIENSKAAIEAAILRGYDMVEVDLRLTKDRIFIIQHAPTFKRYYHVDKPVSSMTWEEISSLRSSVGESRVLKFEEVLKYCKGKIQIMIDNKIPGKDTILFSRLVRLLRKYGMLDHALMIGTSASTPFFTGKIRLSCTRKQLEENMKKPDFSPSNYYLFATPENLHVSDIRWAKKNNILIVAIINKFRYSKEKEPAEKANEDIERLKREGVVYYQIDSDLDAPFFK